MCDELEIKSAELAQYSITVEREMKEITTELKKCLDKLNTKEDTKTLREQIAFHYFKRASQRCKILNLVGAMYDLTLSLQYDASSACFFKRGQLFTKLGFFEQALTDYQSSYEYTVHTKDKEMLEPVIKRLKEAIAREEASTASWSD